MCVAGPGEAGSGDKDLYTDDVGFGVDSDDDIFIDEVRVLRLLLIRLTVYLLFAIKFDLFCAGASTESQTISTDNLPFILTVSSNIDNFKADRRTYEEPTLSTAITKQCFCLRRCH